MRVNSGRLCVSVDTGGTFTDSVVTRDGVIVAVGKAPTTYSSLSDGFFAAVEDAAGQLEMTAEELYCAADTLIYGTTHTVNAYVQGKTAKTALLVTEGFPDTLLFREGGRPEELMFEYNVESPEPYIARRDTFEVPERIDAEGRVHRPLDEAALSSILVEIRERQYEAVAVSLIWSPANPVHELRVGERIEQELPGTPYTLSHQLLPIVREYRRTSLAALDASLKPLATESLGALARALRSSGYRNAILVCTSAGGVVPIEHAMTHPVYLMKSGPAMAPIAARKYAELSNCGGSVIVVDTGGTTFDVGLIQDGEISYTRETWMGQEGIGDLIAMSTVNIKSIGAGGGSIASVDRGGLLSVGPRSAGSEPGPICYGKGGSEPTVTDAAAVAGYLQPDLFFGGRIDLQVDAARQAIGTLGAQIGMEAHAAAQGIVRMASESMIDAIHRLTISVGIDPRASVLVAGGGAAGINIVPIARELGVAKVIVPRHAGVLSAVGMQYSDLTFRAESAKITTSARFDLDGVNIALRELEQKLDTFAQEASNDPSTHWEREFHAEARYAGQVWEVEFKLPVTQGMVSSTDVARLTDAFHEAHLRQYTFSDQQNPVEFISWIGITRGRIAASERPALPRPVRGNPKPLDIRPCWFGTEIDTPIYSVESLGSGMAIEGPATIVSPTSTLVLYPDSAASVTENGDFVISVSR